MNWILNITYTSAESAAAFPPRLGNSVTSAATRSLPTGTRKRPSSANQRRPIANHPHEILSLLRDHKLHLRRKPSVAPAHELLWTPSTSRQRHLTVRSSRLFTQTASSAAWLPWLRSSFASAVGTTCRNRGRPRQRRSPRR